MARQDTRIEIKVGALIVLCLILLVSFLFLLGDFRMGESATLVVDWKTSGGLKKGAPVNVAGMKAGRVEGIEFHGGKMDDELGRQVYVRVYLSIKPELRETLRSDARFYITTVGLLGEKYVEIDPGGAAEILAEDAISEGVPPMRIEVMAENINTVLARTAGILEANEDALAATIQDVRLSAGSARKAIEEGRAMLAETRAAISRLSERTLQVMDTAENTLKEYTPGQGGTGDRIRTIMDRGASVATTVDETLGDGSEIRGILTDTRRLTNRARVVIDRVGTRAISVAGKAEGLMDTAGEMMTEGKGGVLGTITNVNSILATVQTLVDNLRDGQGTIGALLTDREIYDDARELMRDLKRHPWKFLWKE